MTKKEFKIGENFYTGTGEWRCTDIGTRIIVAIHLDQKDSRNYNGPPYSIPENVFDEYDMEGCSLDPSNFEDKKEKIINNHRFNDIENAMMFVSASGYGENSALLDKSTGKIYYQSDYEDMDEFEDFPQEEYDSDIHIKIPHKNDLNLGKDLVFEFVEKFIPDAYEKVDEIFRRRGAYSRYKDLLDDKGVLEKWYDFENQQEQAALLQWCEENNIDLTP